MLGASPHAGVAAEPVVGAQRLRLVLQVLNDGGPQGGQPYPGHAFPGRSFGRLGNASVALVFFERRTAQHA